MPVKDQLSCYRIIGGKKYIIAGDILAPEHEALIAKAKELRLRHRVVRFPDEGFKRLFVLEGDYEKNRAALCEAPGLV